MRIVVLDLGGYPYPLALSRSLGARGHEVLHLYFSGLTPRTSLAHRPDDPTGLSIEAVSLDEPYAKYRFVARRRQERELGRRVTDRIAAFAPQAVMTSNTPLDVHLAVQRWCRGAGAAAIFWLQDLIGVATDAYLRERLPVVGGLVGRWYLGMEDRLLRRSDRVIAITADFVPLLERRRVEQRRIAVIENWAPISEMPLRPRDNDWARKHGLLEGPVFLYAGTLGLKHRPDLLIGLAEMLGDDPSARVVVCSEGPAMDWLREEQGRRSLSNLLLLGFQPYDLVPEVMAAGDVLVALLEPTASGFSVPSKVQTYLCAGRSLLVAIPASNLASRLVSESDCGVAVEPGDTDGFLDAARRLAALDTLRQEMGARARALAERLFEQEAITNRFESVMRETLSEARRPRGGGG